MKVEELCPKNCLSTHIIEGTSTQHKIGSPKKIEITAGKIYDTQQVNAFIENIIKDEKTIVEKQTTGTTILTYQKFRIIITQPPLAKRTEVTIVQHLYDAKLSEYDIPDHHIIKFKHKNGVLIAGAPGQGKSTFVSALLNEVVQDNIVKTIESPRDLQVAPTISQLSNETEKDNIRDQLLLSRPDIVCIDEIRHPKDMSLFEDLRRCGIGCFGVIHATQPIDAITRLLKIIDLGAVSQIIDTVLFIEKGNINRIYTIELEVKVPSGLQGKELTRPVVLVKENEEVVYEIYNFSDQLVVKQPKEQTSPTANIQDIMLLAEMQNKYEIKGNNLIIEKSESPQFETLLKVITQNSPYNVQIKEVAQRTKIPFQTVMTENSIGLKVTNENTCTVFVEENYLLCGKPSKKGAIMVKSESEQGKILTNAIKTGQNIHVYAHEQ